jgi:DNA-binding NtrC family response regulator
LLRGTQASERARGLWLTWVFPRATGETDSIDLSVGSEWEVGRDADCSVRVPGIDISRRHARLVREAGELFLRDLGSRNGTFVNGTRVKSTRVDAGDVVRFGASIGVFTTLPGVATELAPGLWGGPVLAEQLGALAKVAPTDLPVILQGETGTGKEIVARTVHGMSQRSGPFLAVNCAALPEALAEAELFGYRLGAFTGADRASPGVFRSADGGTLLLDEVCDLPTAVQAKLLRALEQREVLPLGEAKPVAVDVRVIVAAQTPLRESVRRKQLRADLFARLDGISVDLPPLRKRIADVPTLFSQLLLAHASGRVPTLDVELVERLCLHDWPFNVRELVGLAKRLMLLYGQEVTLEVAHLPEVMQVLGGTDETAPPDSGVSQTERGVLELRTLMAALRASQGNVAEAAAVLGISRQRAYRMMQAESIDLRGVRAESQGES